MLFKLPHMTKLMFQPSFILQKRMFACLVQMDGAA